MTEANTVTNLDYILGLAYQADVLGKKPITLAEGLFNSAMHDDPAFAGAAKDKLAHLRAIDSRQCFISKTSADFLGRMLSVTA